MKRVEKQMAIEMRREGGTVPDIAKKLGVSRSTVSLWVRDLPLGDERIREGKIKGGLAAAEVKRARISDEMSEVAIAVRSEWPLVRNDPLIISGLSLYAAEGRKRRRKSRNAAGFANCDPRIIQVMIRFLVRIGMDIDRLMFRIQLPNPPTVDEEGAIEYWARSVGVERSMIRGVRVQPTERKRPPKYPHGVCDMYFSDPVVAEKIFVWQEMLLSEISVPPS